MNRSTCSTSTPVSPTVSSDRSESGPARRWPLPGSQDNVTQHALRSVPSMPTSIVSPTMDAGPSFYVQAWSEIRAGSHSVTAGMILTPSTMTSTDLAGPVAIGASSTTVDVADSMSSVKSTTFSPVSLLPSLTVVDPIPTSTLVLVSSTIVPTAGPLSVASTITGGTVLPALSASAASDGESSLSTALPTTSVSRFTAPPMTLATSATVNTDAPQATSLSPAVSLGTVTNSQTPTRTSATSSYDLGTDTTVWTTSSTLVSSVSSQTTISCDDAMSYHLTNAPSSTKSNAISVNTSMPTVYGAAHHFTRPEKVVATITLPITGTIIAAVLGLVIWLEHMRRREKRYGGTRSYIKSSTASRGLSNPVPATTLPPGDASHDSGTLRTPPERFRSVSAGQSEGVSASGTAVREPSLAGSSIESDLRGMEYHYKLKDL